MSAGGGAGAARLPPELLDAVMRLLDREDLLPAAAVCWAWREAGQAGAAAPQPGLGGAGKLGTSPGRPQDT